MRWKQIESGGGGRARLIDKPKKMVMVMFNLAKKFLCLYINSKFYIVQKSITSWQVFDGYLENMIYYKNIRVYEKISRTTHRKLIHYTLTFILIFLIMMLDNNIFNN